MEKRQHIISSLVILLASAAGYIYCMMQPDNAGLSIQPFFLPKIVLAAIFILSLFRLAAGVKLPSGSSEKTAFKMPLKSLGTMVLIGLYALLFKRLGYVISSALYLFLQMMLLKPQKKSALVFAAIAVVASVGTYLLFVYVFDIMLPSGLLGWL